MLFLGLTIIQIPATVRILFLAVLAWMPGWAQTEETAAFAHAETAHRAQEAGDYRKAIQEYQDAIRILPDIAELHNNLGITYYQNHQPALALHSLNTALRLKPHLASSLLFSGLSLYALSQYREAALRLEEAVRENEADATAQTWLAYSLVALRRQSEAVPHFEAAARLQPTNVDIWYGLGQAYLDLGQSEAHALAAVAPDGSLIWRLAGDQWSLLGDRQHAEVLHAKADQRENGGQHPTPNEEDLYRKAKQHEQLAHEAFDKVYALASNSYRAHQITAETLAAQGRYHEAAQEYRAALQQKDDLPFLHSALGDLLVKSGHPVEALAEYDMELSKWPKAGAVYFRRGMALLVLGQNDAALAALQQALAFGADNPEILKQEGKIYLRRGEVNTAIRKLTGYTAKMPGDAQAHFLLMQAFQKTGNHEAALREQRLFQQFSKDAKQRSLAEQELSALQAPEAVASKADTQP